MTHSRCLLAITGAFHSDGGIAAVNRLIIHAFASRGYRIDIFVLTEKEATVDVRYIDPGLVRVCAFNGNKVRFVLSLWRAILQNKYDLVLCDLINLSAALAPLARIGLCRYYAWIYGVDVFPPSPNFEGRLGLTSAAKILAISKFTYDNVTARFPNVRISVCELALDPIRHGRLVSSTAIEDEPEIEMQAVDGVSRQIGPHMILHVGRMTAKERYKGHGVLLEVLPPLIDRFPQMQLVLAGQGNDFARLHLLAQSLPLSAQAQIFLPGFVESRMLEKLYAKCYLFAMPSIGEGFGLVYLEAMSHAKPCIGGKMDAARYVIQDGVTGLLVDNPRSTEQVANAVIWLMEHPDQAKSMGRTGYDRVRANYLFPQFMERFWQAIED